MDYFNFLPDEIIYIICTYIKSDYHVDRRSHLAQDSDGINDKLDRIYSKYIDDIKNGYIENFQRIKPGDITLYPSVEKINNIVWISFYMIEEFFDYKMFKNTFHQEISDFGRWYKTIVKETKDIKYIIYAYYSYGDMRGVDTENMLLVYINNKNEYVYDHYYAELGDEDGRLVSKSWKLIWNKLWDFHKTKLLQFNEYSNV